MTSNSLQFLGNSDEYDARFRTKVRQALKDPRPDIADADVDARFAERRAAVLRGAAEGKR